MARGIARGAGAAVLYTVTAAAVGVVQLRLAVRFLSPEGAGMWTLFVTCGTYIALFDLGLTPTIGREVSLLAASPLDAVRGAVASLLRTASVCSRWLAAGVWALSLALGLALLHRGGVTMLAWGLFSLGAASNLLGSAAFAGLYGLGRVAEEKMIRAGALLAGLAMAVCFLRVGWGMAGIALASTLQGLLARTAAFWRLHALLGRETLRRAAMDWPRVRGLSGPSLKLAGIQVASVAIFQSANPASPMSCTGLLRRFWGAVPCAGEKAQSSGF